MVCLEPCEDNAKPLNRSCLSIYGQISPPLFTAGRYSNVVTLLIDSSGSEPSVLHCQNKIKKQNKKQSLAHRSHPGVDQASGRGGGQDAAQTRDITSFNHCCHEATTEPLRSDLFMLTTPQFTPCSSLKLWSSPPFLLFILFLLLVFPLCTLSDAVKLFILLLPTPLRR